MAATDSIEHVEQLRRWAERLNACESDERRRLLDERDAAVCSDGSVIPAGCLPVLRLLFPEHGPPDGPPDRPPMAAALIDALDRMIHDRETARRLLAEWLAFEHLQQAWADWTHVTDRDELRLRLDVLGRSDAWDENLAGFVTFFFRASVADLYQPAAIAMGVHLHQSPRLREYLANYSGLRDLPLDRPIELNGQRPARRVMLALAAAPRGAAGGAIGGAGGSTVPGMALIEDPIPHEVDERGRRKYILPDNAADLATVLLALSVLHTSAGEFSAAADAVRCVLDRVSHLRSSQVSRAVILRYGGLLVQFGGEETLSLWMRMFENRVNDLRRIGPGRFGERAAALIMLDELLRTIVFLAEPRPHRIVDHLLHVAGLSQPERLFAAMRLATWCWREQRRMCAWVQAAVTEAESSLVGRGAHARGQAGLSVIERCFAAARARLQPAGSFFAEAGQDGDAELFDDLFGEMCDAATWLRRDESQRAFIAMMLLDLARHTHLGADQARALLQRHGIDIPDHASPSDSGHTQHITSLSAVCSASVLLRLLTWEKPGAEELIDVRMLHRIDDLRVLLALIPTARRSALLPILADAFEHQLRWRLRRESDFSPEVFLLLMQVRQPHHQLLQSLAALCEGKTYRGVDSSETAVLPLVRHMVEEAEWSIEADKVDQAPGPPRLPGDSTVSRSVNRLRERLVAVLAARDDPQSGVEQLLDTFGEVASRSSLRSGTVMGVLETLTDAAHGLLEDGYPAWHGQSFNEYLRDLEGDLVRMKHYAHALMPDTWRGADEARESVTALRSLLLRRLDEWARFLPNVEAQLLRRLQVLLDEELRQWGATIERVLDHWPESLLRRDGINLESAREAMVAISHIEHAPLRSHLMALLWRSLQHWADAMPATGQSDAWSQRRRLLDAALTSAPVAAVASTSTDSDDVARWSEDDRANALAALVTLWCDMARGAMERNEEQRVVELATAERYVCLRQSGLAAETLAAVRTWCFDRYLLHCAGRVRNDQRAVDGRPRRGVLSEIGPFLGHYSTIWLAMLIGAILMLDFGDAWAEMAQPEIGDVRGIVITFLIGIGGAFGYIFWNLKRKSRLSPGESAGKLRLSQLVRCSAFAGCCLAYTLLVVSGLWWLLSRTDAVVEGVWAIGHIIVWSGFAMFVGVFFGLIAGDA